MPETQYRASRVCRVLGNPTAYQIVHLLLNAKLRPSDIADEMGISLTLASATLRTLRNVDVLRYETRGKEKIYWIKETRIQKVLDGLETFVTTMRNKAY